MAIAYQGHQPAKEDKSVEFYSLLSDMKVLLATEKPFAKAAVEGIKDVFDGVGYELAILEKYTDKQQLLDAVADVDALIIRSDKVTAEVIEAARNLKIIVRAGAGYDNVDLAAASDRRIVVMNTPGQNSNAVAELAIGLMIFMSRNCFTPGTGCELDGKRLGIHAYGNVGKLVARHAKGFGMDIYAYDPFITDLSVFEKDGITPVSSVEELYSKSDYISLNIPATPETRKSVGYALLSKLPAGAVVINTARKEVIDEEGLMKVLEERKDLRYATDIAADIQPTLDEKFGSRVFATRKKMGAETEEANVNAAIAAAKEIVAYFRDNDTRFQVNKW